MLNFDGTWGAVKSRIVVRAGLVLTAILSAAMLTGSNRPDRLIVYSNGGKAVYREVSGAIPTAIYETTADFITNGDAKLSPTNNYIAVVETREGVIPPGGYDYSVLPENNLVIIDTSGNIICSTGDNARKCSWSPDGKKLAYIAGTYIEGGLGFKTTGVYELDVPICIKKKIVKDYSHPVVNGDEGGGYDLSWAKHDSNLYVQEFPALGGNYLYDPKTGKTQQVAYKGIYFSPDGRYYLSIDPEGLRTSIYVTTTNEDITTRVRQRIKELPAGWVSGRPHHLLATISEYDIKRDAGSGEGKARAYPASKSPLRAQTFILYDVEKDSVEKEWIEQK